MAYSSMFGTGVMVLVAALCAACSTMPAPTERADAPVCGLEQPITADLVNDAAEVDGLKGFAGRDDILVGHLSYMREPREAAETASGTVLFFRRSGGWRAIVPLQQESAVGLFSKTAGSGLIMIVLQRQIGDPGQSFTLVRTEDDFATSTCVTLPFPEALNQPTWNGEFLELRHLNIDARGRGALIGSAALDRTGEAPRTLWFAYTTRDGGRTWSSPRAASRDEVAPFGDFTPVEEVAAPALEAELHAYTVGR